MILFASDIHLSPGRPAGAQAFRRFLERAAERASTLYLLGDIFDLWIGDDDPEPLHREAEAWMAQAGARGLEILVLPGNHDFLLGPGFAHRAGCRLLEEPVRLQLGGRPTVLMHGDALCIDDREYQAFREESRRPETRAWFLGLPLAERRHIARDLQARSGALNAERPERITDASPAEAQRVLELQGALDLVHGHTHRPRVHRHRTPLGEGRRYVLGSWHERDWVLACSGGEYRLGSVEEVLGD